jgi:hypothetical protein
MADLIPKETQDPFKRILLSKENLEILRAYKCYVEIEKTGIIFKNPFALKITIPMGNPKVIFNKLKPLFVESSLSLEDFKNSQELLKFLESKGFIFEKKEESV